MKVYEALAKAFVAEGTTAVFGLMGDTTQYWIDALAKLGTPMYESRHEGAGVSMAEGWARIKGAPGVCTTTSGPGTTQIATAMTIANRDRTPLIAFCGDTPVNSDHSQSMNHERFAAAIESGFVRLTSADSAYEVVQKAFYLARSESRPILLSVPSNMQKLEFDDAEEYTLSTALFNNAPIYPNPNAIEAAVNLVAHSERPVIIAGRGAMRSGAGEAILKLGNRTGAVIATSLLAMNWLRDQEEYHVGVSGLYSTKTAIELFAEADCVVAVGASLNHYTTEHGYLFPNAKFVHFDTEPQVVMGDGRMADCYVRCDARIGVEALDRLLVEQSVQQTGYRTPEVKERIASALDDSKVYEIAPGMVDPRQVMRVLDEMLPKEVGYVTGGGLQSSYGPVLATRARPFSFSTKGFGSIGQGMVTAIGATIASGKQPVFVTEGDAGFMMHLAEFETAVRYNLPLLVAVLNNQALGFELFKPNFDPELARIRTPNLGAVGLALGGRGALVRTIEELRTATSEFVTQPAPTLLDVRIPEDVFSIQYRRLQGDDEN